LKNLRVKIPLGRLVCVTGVSGSGKSTLVREVVYDNLRRRLSEERRGRWGPGAGKVANAIRSYGGALGRGKAVRSWVGCAELRGWEAIDRVLEVDQTPIGKTPRSCPATYVGFWDDVRRLFAGTPEAKMRGFGPGRFSFNVAAAAVPSARGRG